MRLRAFVFAVLATVAPVLPAHAAPAALAVDQALRYVGRDDADVRGCMQSDAKSMREGTSASDLAQSPRIVLVEIQSTCICGEHNCPFWIYRLDGTGAKVLAHDFAVDVKPVRSASAGSPPDLVATAHDSAAVSDSTRFAYRNGTYASVDSWRVRNDTGERKPMSIEVKFAPGTSSARLHGKTAVGWEDVYAFAAAAGQRISIGDVSPSRGLDVELAQDGKSPVRVAPGGPSATLPASGRYRLTVEPSGDAPDAGMPYSFTLTIR